MKKQWINHQGQEVPAQYVPKLDKIKERFALKYLKRAQKAHKLLADLKRDMFAEGDKLWEEMKANAKVRTGEKNFTITSFDKSIKIEFTQSELVRFDDTINLAKAKIDEYLGQKLKDTDDDLRALVNLAFQTRKGKLDAQRVLGLFKLNIKHKLWVEAMELIRQSIDRNKTARYARILVRDPDTDKYHGVDLNFSSI